jgi:hypothetical protein
MRILLITAVAVGMATAAFAQQPSGGQQKGGVCRAEVETLCGAAKAQGREAMRACLEEKRGQFSAACQEDMKKMREGRKDDRKGQCKRMAACQPDVSSLCSGVQPGEGRILQCLKQNEAKVSQACKDALAKGKKG